MLLQWGFMAERNLCPKAKVQGVPQCVFIVVRRDAGLLFEANCAWALARVFYMATRGSCSESKPALSDPKFEDVHVHLMRVCIWQREDPDSEPKTVPTSLTSIAPQGRLPMGTRGSLIRIEHLRTRNKDPRATRCSRPKTLRGCVHRIFLETGSRILTVTP